MGPEGPDPTPDVKGETGQHPRMLDMFSVTERVGNVFAEEVYEAVSVDSPDGCH